jgi:hypothetical protein
LGLIIRTPLPRGTLLSVELPGEAERLRAPLLARVRQQDAQVWRVGAALALPLVEHEIWAVLAVAHGVSTTAPNSAPAAKGSPDLLRLGPAGERRISIRRTGAGVRLQVSPLWGRSETLVGSVVNRSPGGLVLHLPKPLPVRAGLWLRAEHAPLRMARVQGKVCHGTWAGNGWLVGVCFLSTPPADVLLTFGYFSVVPS